MYLNKHVVLLVADLVACFAASVPRAESHHQDNEWPPREATSLGSEDDAPRSTYAGESPSSTSRGPPDPECTNGPSTRHCWGGGYSVETDFDVEWPETGHVVEYSLEISNTTMAPDGIERLVMAVNGQFPGPTIQASMSISSLISRSYVVNEISLGWHSTDPPNQQPPGQRVRYEP